MKKILAFSKKHGTMIKHGALAQLGARHTGSVEATGSSPVCSIFKKPCKYVKMAYLQGFLFPIFQVCQYGPES